MSTTRSCPRPGRRAQASRCRQQLHQDLQRLQQLLPGLLRRDRLLAASVYLRQRSCGKRGGRCGRGLLHRSLILAVASGGQSRQCSWKNLDEVRVKEAVEQYRRFRRLRQEVAHLTRRLVQTLDALGRCRTVSIARFRKQAG